MSSGRALLICPNFFGLKDTIYHGMSHIFEQVVYFPDRPIVSSIGKALIKTSETYRNYISNKHTNFILDAIRDSVFFDYVLIVKGTCITTSFFNEIKNINPDVKVVVYLWDSICNAKYSLELAKAADDSYTFDPVDSQVYGIPYHPLFFTKYSINEKLLLIPPKLTFKYSCSFVGSYHGDRVKVLYSLLQNLSLDGDRLISVYFQSKLQFIFHYFLDPYLRKMPFSCFSFNSMTAVEFESVILQSEHVIDINSEKQTGLTSRTIDAIVMGKKVITTNPCIFMHADPGRVICFDRSSFDILSASDLKMPFGFYFDAISYDKVCIEKWCRFVLGV
jgi:hypothetical protein